MTSANRFLINVLTICMGGMTLHDAAAQGFDPQAIPGIVIDDVAAKLTGDWKKSVSVKPFVGQGYIHSSGPAAKAVFRLNVPEPGEYEVLVSYTHGSNRPDRVTVGITGAAAGPIEREINQKARPDGPLSFHRLGRYRFEAKVAEVSISSEATGAIIADAVALQTPEQLAETIKLVPKIAVQVVVKQPNKPAKKQPETKPVVLAKFERVKPSGKFARLTSAELDSLLNQHRGEVPDDRLINDAQLLCRASLDLTGRQPTLAQLNELNAAESQDRRTKIIDELLASPDFGESMGNYWADIVRFRTPQPQLTFLNYRPFKRWVADQINGGKKWDEVVFRILTATGKVGDNPAATFIGFHQAERSRLASETTRIFLSTQVQCAECHDHKFIEMPRETFHHLAAFFVRTSANLPWNDSDGIEVKSKDKGEHKMTGAKGEMQPMAFDSLKVDLGTGDIERREALAQWVVAGDNPWFARSFVNHVWARMMGRGFCEPVDEIGELADAIMPDVHEAVAGHFIASGFDIRDLVRLIARTRHYQCRLGDSGAGPSAVTDRLRGDEVFDSLVRAIELPNVTPEQKAASGAFRFPPPPKSTRDLVNQAYEFDPALPKSSVIRSMKQAMFMMNNAQIQQQINARTEETMLARLLAAEPADEIATGVLFMRVFARRPTEAEVKISLEHIGSSADRQTAYEDLLWSLLNSAEFVTRR